MQLQMAKWKNPISKNAIASLSIRERIFLLCAWFISWGFIHFDVRARIFSRIGIPLNLLKSDAANYSPEAKLYITEIFILALCALCLGAPGALGRLKKLFSRNLVSFFLAAVISVGFLRAIPDATHSPILVVRNLAFVWYLIIPILIYLAGISISCLEIYALVVGAVGSIYFLVYPFYWLQFGIVSLYWIPFLGLYGALFLCFFSPSWLWKSLSVFIWAMALGVGFHLGYQRTNLLGSFFLIFLFLIISKSLKKMIFTVFFIGVSSFLIGVLVGKAVEHYHLGFDAAIKNQLTNPLVKAQSNDAGLEIFRTQMWLDSLETFKQHPIFGIGFEKQVVYRVLLRIDELGNRVFVPNDGESWNYRDKTPISGPHNSYLNAIVRMGIMGVFLLALHLIALLKLFRTGYYALFCLAYAQVIYACFNVGLEGPIRSFFLLISLGAFLVLHFDKSQAHER